ncbi:MAG: 3TM-type holin [Odoribacter sp.]|nr:3TM-type holin [Odoribacter sp.]MDE6878177.1 holin family protein [Odoribacter sp.]
MKLLSGLIGEIGGVVNTLSVSSKEKKRIEAELLQAVNKHEEELNRSRAAIIRSETQGNWLQRSWRPVVMLVFAVIVLAGTFWELPILADTSRFWDLLEIGIGGYVIGRSAEKITGRWKGGRS